MAAAATAGIVCAPFASADAAEPAAPSTQSLGGQAKLVNGDVIQGWTISNLQPSSDTIPHQVNGTLWEATATDHALQGSVTPIVSNINARAADGQTYRALFGAATPQGVNPATIPQGEQTSGKVYFDVTGSTPSSVVYNSGGEDLAVWTQAPHVVLARRNPVQVVPVHKLSGREPHDRDTGSHARHHRPRGHGGRADGDRRRGSGGGQPGHTAACRHPVPQAPSPRAPQFPQAPRHGASCRHPGHARSGRQPGDSAGPRSSSACAHPSGSARARRTASGKQPGGAAAGRQPGHPAAPGRRAGPDADDLQPTP